jgi:hypothetical protein
MARERGAETNSKGSRNQTNASLGGGVRPTKQTKPRSRLGRYYTPKHAQPSYRDTCSRLAVASGCPNADSRINIGVGYTQATVRAQLDALNMPRCGLSLTHHNNGVAQPVRRALFARSAAPIKGAGPARGRCRVVPFITT